jgi:hypothetical protein
MALGSAVVNAHDEFKFWGEKILSQSTMRTLS